MQTYSEVLAVGPPPAGTACEAKEPRRPASPGRALLLHTHCCTGSPWPDYNDEYPCFPDLETETWFPEITLLVRSRVGAGAGCFPYSTEAACPASVRLFRFFLMHDHWLDLILNNKLLPKRRLPQKLSRPWGLFRWRVYAKDPVPAECGHRVGHLHKHFIFTRSRTWVWLPSRHQRGLERPGQLTHGGAKGKWLSQNLEPLFVSPHTHPSNSECQKARHYLKKYLFTH